MDTTTRNSLIWIVVLIVEAILLKLLKNARLWFYIALPILGGFAVMEAFRLEAFKPRPKKSSRNLK